MNNFTYETQGTNTYLVYTLDPNETIDTLSLGMIANNSISGLTQTTCLQMDESKFIRYNVTAKISVKQFFEGSVNKKRLLGVFKGIVDAMLAAEEYMIDPNMILLDTNYIFTDVTTCDTALVCLPVLNDNLQQVDLCSFFKNIMFSTQFDQTENCDYIAKIMNSLNAPVFSLLDFKNVLDSIDLVGNTAVNNVTAMSIAPIAVNRPVQDTTIKSADAIKKQPVIQKTVEPAQAIQNNIVEPISKPSFKNHKEANNTIVPPPQVEPKTTAEASDEKPMSAIYLLQHFTKENKAIFEAQRMSKKSKSASKSDKKTDTKKSVKAAPVNSGFAIPGVVEEQNPVANPKNMVPPVNKVEVVKAAAPVQPVVQPTPQPVQPVVQPAPQPAQQPIYNTMSENAVRTAPVSQGFSGSFGETVVLNAGAPGDTTVLNTNMLNYVPNTPYLIRVKNNERIHINKPAFRIGKEKSYVDYFIGDNTAISRSHANIIERNGEYYIMDTNSTNHTFVDNQMVPSNQEQHIKSGSKIKLANEEFIFTIE